VKVQGALLPRPNHLWDGRGRPSGCSAFAATHQNTNAGAYQPDLKQRPALDGARPSSVACRDANAPRKIRTELLAPLRFRSLLNPTGKVPRCPMLVQRRLVHDHTSRPLQVLDQSLRGDPCHHLDGIVGPLSAVEPEREREGQRDLVPGGGAKLGRIGHRRTIGEGEERSKNIV